LDRDMVHGMASEWAAQRAQQRNTYTREGVYIGNICSMV